MLGNCEGKPKCPIGRFGGIVWGEQTVARELFGKMMPLPKPLRKRRDLMPGRISELGGEGWLLVEISDWRGGWVMHEDVGEAREMAEERGGRFRFSYLIISCISRYKSTSKQ